MAHGLVGVGGRDEVAVLGRQQRDDVRLRRGEVLEVVDEHVAPAGGEARAHVRAPAQEALAAQDEVAEIQRAALGEHRVVRRVDGGELPLALGARLVVGQRGGPGA